MEDKRGLRPPTAPSPYYSLGKMEPPQTGDVIFSNMGLPPRPGTSGDRSQPTAGDRSKSLVATKSCLSNFSNLSYQTPDVECLASTSATAVLQRELNSDSLLRILDEVNAYKSNEVIIMSETGDFVGITAAIDSGIDLISCRGLAGYTPLHHACNRGHVAIVGAILRNNMRILNSSNDTGETALHLAVYAGNMNIVEQLLDHGANIDGRNDYGETALFYAARKGMPALVRLLLQRGSDIDIIDRFGEKAIEHSSDPHTMLAFVAQKIDQSGMLPSNELLLVFQFLDAREICRCAMVAGKWHRVSETESIWAALGVRR